MKYRPDSVSLFQFAKDRSPMKLKLPLSDETLESDPINFLEIGEELPNLPEPKTIGQTPSIEMTESEDEDMVNPIQGGTAEQGNKPDEALLVASRTFPDEQSRESTASEDLMRLEVPDLPQQSNVNRSEYSRF